MFVPSPRVTAILPSGSGACVVHEVLARRLPDYCCLTYDPRLEYLPLLLTSYRLRAGPIVHAPPDHAIAITPGRSRLLVTLHNYVLDRDFEPHCSLSQRIHYRTDLRWLTRKALQRADRITAVSQFTADLAREDLGIAREIDVIPNGIDVDRFYPRPRAHDGVRVLYCGNLSRRKGAHLLPAIARGLKPGIELWIASGLRGKVVGEAWPENVKLLGRIDRTEMPSLYNDVDMLLLPTTREGLSLAVAEAMACGIAVVATRCSSLPEQILEGEGGFLATLSSVGEFIERINELASDHALRLRMGAFNRARVMAHYDEKAMIAAYAKVLDGLD